MRIMIAKNPFSWMGLFLLALATLWPASGQASDDSPREALKGLSTKSGKTYHDVRVVKVDPNGLLFRHRTGSAKVPFSQLSVEIRAHYGYNELAAEAFENLYEGRSGALQGAARAEDGAPKANGAAAPATVGLVRTRVTVTLPAASFGGGLGYGDAGWSPCHSPYNYGYGYPQSHGYWRMPHPLVYASYPWRQLAERDFLITTGLLPAPAGVVPLPLYRTLRHW